MKPQILYKKVFRTFIRKNTKFRLCCEVYRLKITKKFVHSINNTKGIVCSHTHEIQYIN